MPSLPSGTSDLASKNFPNSLKQALAILACSAALILVSWTSVLRAAPQSQTPPPPPPAKQATPDASAIPQASTPPLRVVQQMVQVDII